ncbi:MAG: class I tRNA ligase family protein [Candidatus Liptonbacteria bacterium]|nr:class I tRNA ligase family protein [Candidatus Liptonbacteria bacterium]
MDTRYDHQRTEEKIYRLWEESGYFNPNTISYPLPATSYQQKKKLKARSNKLEAGSYCIIMPPPNANGSLHLGHAVNVTLQDILARFWRMRGLRTLWLPGADHAGFETQVVFDKKLEKEGRNRSRMDRDALWKEIWDFTQQNKKTMEGQLRKLGASCDWSREKFTLDPDIVKIVYDTFGKLYRDGLAYRDLRVVNWCPKHQTALSDLEVKHVEREDPLYYLTYGPLTLATVRPETKFGDTALAVNPHDRRYKKYIGKEIEADGVLGPLRFKVIADEAVDPKFGTGVIKVTPAHDPADFEIWQRHKNEIPGPKAVIDERGRLTGETGKFKGLKVSEAREKVAEEMKRIGILEKIESRYAHTVATCYKCGTTLEPLPKPQWFVRMTAKPHPKVSGVRRQVSGKSLRDLGIEAVKSRKIRFFPERMKKIYLHWLENIRDWNISRQIVWGLRIPAYFCLGCGRVQVNPQVKARWYLLRHGETDWNKNEITMGQADVPLNDTGRAQAEGTARALKAKGIDAVITSDLARTRETAEIIARATGAELIVDAALRERHLGVTQGMPRAERDAQYGEVLYGHATKPPGGESFADLEERVWAAFARHRRSHHHKNIVVVTHGGPIRTLLKRFRRWSHETMIAHWTKNNQMFELALLESTCTHCGGDVYEQDPDVFDTWFSSGQWPFATLMASAATSNQQPATSRRNDFKTFYPTNVLVTAYEILFFWVARMVMLGLYRTGKIPFKNVYLHGLVRDKDRVKMSKSKGNVIDPLGVSHIYGTDAVRMALVAGNTAGRDIMISEDKIRGYRNFATKVWNIARFVLMHKPDEANETVSRRVPRSAFRTKHLAGLARVKKAAARHLEKLEFHRAAELIYHYIWHTFADTVVEGAKPGLLGGKPEAQAAAYRLLEEMLLECLTMLHPFMPFLTEELYQKLVPRTEPGGRLLMTKRW